LFYAIPVVLQALGINLFMVPGFEADDVMATLGKWSHARGLNVVHVSDDQDMLQLISPGVHVSMLTLNMHLADHEQLAPITVCYAGFEPQK
jgi:5'-3' exonuclease